MSTPPVTHLTAEQYLAGERAAESKSEYLNGETYAMPGGGFTHALLAAAVIARLDEQLRGKPCVAAGSDLRLFCKAANVFTYPDVVVSCEPRRFLDGEKDTLTDATVIVEVLSRSTQNCDRGERFRFYQALPSFSEYVLLVQSAIRAEHHVRQQDGSWLFRELSGPQAVVDLKSIGCRLNLGSLYDRVEFDAAQSEA